VRKIRLGLSQINTTVGDIDGNVRRIIEQIERAVKTGVDVLAFPELTITGYPPEDLLFKPHFIQRNIEALSTIASHVPDNLMVVVGFVDEEGDIYNGAAVLHDGKVVGKYHKNYLPNYGVFDEMRYFQHGDKALVVSFKGMKIGITICEDIWYPGGPARTEALVGDAEIIINISASPYYMGKLSWRERMLSVRANDNLAAVAYVNCVGGQDELAFDGASLVIRKTEK